VDIWRERVSLRDAEGERRSLTLRELRKEVARGGTPLPSDAETGKSRNRRQDDRGSE